MTNAHFLTMTILYFKLILNYIAIFGSWFTIIFKHPATIYQVQYSETILRQARTVGASNNAKSIYPRK